MIRISSSAGIGSRMRVVLVHVVLLLDGSCSRLRTSCYGRQVAPPVVVGCGHRAGADSGSMSCTIRRSRRRRPRGRWRSGSRRRPSPRSAPSSPRAASRRRRRTPSSIQPASSAAPSAGGAPFISARSSSSAASTRSRASIRSVESVGDQRRGAHRQRGADRAVAVEHRAQRQQVVAEALQRGSRARSPSRSGRPPRPGRRRDRGAPPACSANSTSCDGLLLARAGSRRGAVAGAPVAMRRQRPSPVGAKAYGPRPTPPPLKRRITLISSRSWRSAAAALSAPSPCSAMARNCGSQAARPMPSLRIASIGASIASARTSCTPCGSCRRGERHPQPDDRDDQDVGLVDVAGLGVEHREGALEPLAVERELGAAVPERGDEDGQHPRGALAGLGGDLLAALLQVGRGDAGQRRPRRGPARSRQRAQLASRSRTKRAVSGP